MNKLLSFTIVTLLILTGSNSIAQFFGDWFVGDKPGQYHYAITINDSGAVLGQYCFPSGNCVWLVAMSARCNEGDQYPILANSDAGAAHLAIQCNGQLENGLYRYVFTDFDLVDSTMKKGSLVGFAIPLDQDQFRVVRFRLNGVKSALATMQSRVEKGGLSPTSTRDQTF